MLGLVKAAGLKGLAELRVAVAGDGAVIDEVGGDVVAEAGERGVDGGGGAAEGGWTTADVSIDAADLEVADDGGDDLVVVEEAFILADGQLVDVADHEVLRDVLEGDGLFALERVGVLDAARAAVKGGEGGQCGVGVGEGLGPGVGGEEIETVREAALELGGEGVVAGVAEVFDAAVGVDVVVLGEGAEGLAEVSGEAGVGDGGPGGERAIEGCAEAEVAWVEVVELEEIGVEVGAGGADIAEGEDQVLGELLLDLETPVIDGGGDGRSRGRCTGWEAARPGPGCWTGKGRGWAGRGRRGRPGRGR